MSSEISSERPKKGLQTLFRKPWFLGVVIGFMAAFLQALLASGGGPEAYGFCVACHTRDLVDDIYNQATGSSLVVAPMSANGATAVLTMVGVMIGAFIAAKVYKEFKIKKGSVKEYIWYFIGGILVLNFALLLGGCPYRAALRFAYGDLVALIGIIAMAAGVFVGTRYVLYKMQKEDV